MANTDKTTVREIKTARLHGFHLLTPLESKSIKTGYHFLKLLRNNTLALFYIKSLKPLVHKDFRT